MPDDPKPPDGEKPEEKPDTPDPPASDPPAEEPFDKDRAMRTITQLREKEKEGRAAAKRAADAEARLKALEDAQKTEAERQTEALATLQARESTWETERQALRLKLAVYSRQADLAIADADLAIAALDHSKVEWDDAGQPTNLDAVLTELLDAKPILRAGKAKPKSASTDAGAGTQPGPRPALTAEQLAVAKAAGMDPAEYAKWAGVDTVDAAQKLTEAAKT